MLPKNKPTVVDCQKATWFQLYFLGLSSVIFFTMNACTIVGLSSVGLKNLNFGLVQVFKSFFSKPENAEIFEAIFQFCSVELDDDESQGMQQHH